MSATARAVYWAARREAASKRKNGKRRAGVAR